MQAEWSLGGGRAPAGGDVVVTPSIAGLVRRASVYLAHDLPLHLSGPPGVGKTTLALHLARLRGRPVMLVHGDDTLTTAELVGAPAGYVRRLVVDEFIRTVFKREETATEHWVASRLAVACRAGATLVYDEFTRSRPEANNVLLPVLEEKVLPIPTAVGEVALERVHPEFRLILTSNPEEPAGVHPVQQALLDRVVTLALGAYPADELPLIVAHKTGLPEQQASRLVRTMLAWMERCRRPPGPSLLRAALMAARVVVAEQVALDGSDPRLAGLLGDLLGRPPEDGEGRRSG